MWLEPVAYWDIVRFLLQGGHGFQRSRWFLVVSFDPKRVDGANARRWVALCASKSSRSWSNHRPPAEAIPSTTQPLTTHYPSEQIHMCRLDMFTVITWNGCHLHERIESRTTQLRTSQISTVVSLKNTNSYYIIYNTATHKLTQPKVVSDMIESSNIHQKLPHKPRICPVKTAGASFIKATLQTTFLFSKSQTS